MANRLRAELNTSDYEEVVWGETYDFVFSANTTLGNLTGTLTFDPIEESIWLNKDDLIRENFEQAQSHVDVDATIDEIEEFLERKPLWYESTSKSVNKIYDLFPNNNFKFHRGSEQVKTIYTAWQTAKQKEELKLMDDKWNPADIWLVSPKVSEFSFSNDLSVLNGSIANLFCDSELIGISLKMIGKKADAKSEIFNGEGCGIFEYKYELHEHK